MTPSRFGSRVAVVTGGAHGIGAAVVRRIASEGGAVVIADIDPVGADLAAAITEEGLRASYVRCDVSSEGDWERLREATRAAWGEADIVVSNAFTADARPADEMAPLSWERQIAVNLTATFLGVRTFGPGLRARGGNLVIVSSVHALAGVPRHPAYAAAKGGLTALTRQLAVDYGPELRVNAVLPGPILTRAWHTTSEEQRARSIAQTAAKRFGTAEEVAAVVAFIASDEASYMTGSSVVVDGGWSVLRETV